MGEQQTDRTSQKHAVTGRISPQLMEMLRDYMESRGYNQSEAVRRLLEQSLITETDVAVEQLTELHADVEDLESEVAKLGQLRTTVEHLESEIDVLRDTVSEKSTTASRVGNLEDRVQRLEALEWDDRGFDNAE